MSNVIKRFDSSEEAGATRVFDPVEIGRARMIIASAEEQAERIIADAESEAERIGRQAHDEGLQAGTEAVRGELEQQMAVEIRKLREQEVHNLVKAFQAIVTEVDEYRDRLIADSKEQLVSLAMNIARGVVKREIRHSDDVAQLNLEEAIRLSAKRTKLLVRVSETDMNTLDTMLESPMLLPERESAIELIPSSDVHPGGCVVESASGSVDARIETQLREIEKVLLGD